MTKIELQPDERIDEIADSGVQIIQSKEVFSFSIDAILLARFPRLPKKGQIVDLCAGNGAVGLFASSRTKASIIELELQERLAKMAERSISLNGLDEQMSVINDNLNQAMNYFSNSSTDLIFCNPPYFKVGEDSHLNESQHYTLARHELATNLDEIFEISKKLLKSNGHLAMVHRPERFFEIVDKMRANNLQPKWIQFVYPKADLPANILLIDAIKDGKPGGEIFLPPLIVHHEDGSYTKEIEEIYYGKN
ncbi:MULTISPECIES: tRNA1(Val) (adenine(37)-N6)-methyltransferase [unclassified Lactococcus]|uniref:tRNA1(Val) (adenine(37)-N6)-methyltransferase n=1 Tax=unclassified Lactococcus TaxID=2643510 RepID=UPI0011C9AD9C|nr:MULTISPECIES: tRNA1(Val) (adenine(37)-N6)-methyltransferase [unclassified Lactococcus]MQW23607.1 methyltransferase [Lactococcus sp. dk101]TXK37705.1 tRNA1(Val) (adenine(37)-N6)-methyltransferase [Lactococcus sp. dk310]TXK49211.1 tRNA1(Val) (adenine(37)-N6)-methyltransferase [Lactococcus sp. dk322]